MGCCGSQTLVNDSQFLVRQLDLPLGSKLGFQSFNGPEDGQGFVGGQIKADAILDILITRKIEFLNTLITDNITSEKIYRRLENTNRN
jgi:hypothetical protein